MRVLLVVLAALSLASTAAAADRPNEMYLQVEAVGEVRVWINDTLPQEHWSQIRVAADQNEDGQVSDGEAALFEEVYREELENHPSQKTTLNGQTVTLVSASIHVEGLRGPVTDTDPVIARAEAFMGYAINDDAQRLEWERVPYEDEVGRSFAMTAPPGWVVASHSGIVDASTTSTRVAGQIGPQTLTVILVPQEAYEAWPKENRQSVHDEDESPAPTDASNDDEGDDAVELAAPGWIVASFLLLGAIFLQRRRA